MLKKIMKGGHKKPSKSDGNDYGVAPLGTRNSGSGPASNVVVNHASRTAPSPPNNGTTVAAPPPMSSVETLPQFRDVPVSERQNLFLRKLQFVEKDYKLADTVIRGLLKYWPLTNCQKEVLFLGELEEVLEATQSAEFQRCMVPLFRQIARCLTSSHFQVAERALFLWNNEHIVSLIAQNRTVILPIIFEALEKNIQSHWNQAVHGLTVNVRKMFLEMDTELFEECERRYQEKESRAKEVEEQREMTWKRLADVAAQKVGEDMHPNPIGSGLATEAMVESAGPDCVVPGQITPVRLLGLKVWPIDINLKFMEPVGRELKLLGKGVNRWPLESGHRHGHSHIGHYNSEWISTKGGYPKPNFCNFDKRSSLVVF
ncbi:hypothetical protein GH714_028567 [Hevea brasiliensis]|uniref:Serine/threonine protein phosphatase 2A regulatory subunit n=1 Tax=Hevea brasiliensis TaxID=3981 RepID=A0A6A6M2C1_HEVBR|nr:hypothetical protein GH714_028567 [Hevea brasiliensis]